MPGQQLALDLNIQPPFPEMARSMPQLTRQYNVRTAEQLKRVIRHLRNEVRPYELGVRLWNMSKRYSRMDKQQLVRVAVAMNWEIENYKQTGKVTEG